MRLASEVLTGTASEVGAPEDIETDITRGDTAS